MICFMCYGNKFALYSLCTDSAQTEGEGKTHTYHKQVQRNVHEIACIIFIVLWEAASNTPPIKTRNAQLQHNCLPSDVRTNPLVRGHCREGTDNIEHVPDKQINTRQWSRLSPLCLSCARTNLQYIWPCDCLKLSHRTNTRQTNKHTPVIRVESFVFVMSKHRLAIHMAL